MKNVTNVTSISYSRAIARRLGLQEKDIWQLLVGTKISTHRFIYDNTPVEMDDQKIIFQNTLALYKDASCGLAIGQTLAPLSHGTMGSLANCSPTLYTAMEDFGKFLPTRVSFGSLDLVCTDEEVICRMETVFKDDPIIDRMIIEAFSVSLKILIETVTAKPFTNGKVHYMHEQPPYWGEYAKHFSCPYFFKQSTNEITFPISMKESPNISSDFAAYRTYKDLCQAQLAKLNTTIDSTSDRVRKQLMLTSPGTPVNEASVASAMFISKRTLSRRLKKENTNFRKLKSEAFNSLAKSYLEDTDIPVENIAVLLGYHDSSSFRRAFKRDNVIGPQAFRNLHRKKLAD